MRLSKHVLAAVCGLVVLITCDVELAAAQKQPNILVIMGDDVGWYNIGAYHQGIMAGKTEMPGSPLKLAAPVQPTLRRLSFFDNLRFRRCQRF